MERIIFLFVFVLLFSCNKKAKTSFADIQTFEESVDTLQLYNDVFNDLIENYTYNYYLGDDFLKLQKDFLYYKTLDSAQFLRASNKLKSDILNKFKNKSTIFLNLKGNSLSHLKTKGVIERYKLDYSPSELDTILNQVSNIDQSKIESEFVNIDLVGKFLTEKHFGSIYLSQVYLNKDKDEGIMYFSFVCGMKCGEGSIVKIKNLEGQWKVIGKFGLSEI